VKPCWIENPQWAEEAQEGSKAKWGRACQWLVDVLSAQSSFSGFGQLIIKHVSSSLALGLLKRMASRWGAGAHGFEGFKQV